MNYVLEEYYKKVCQKAILIDEQHTSLQQQMQQLLVSPEDASSSIAPAIKSTMITGMRGIDYNKIAQYLQVLEQKKKRKLLKSQGSKNRDNVSSQNECFSEAGVSTSQFQFNNVTPLSHINASENQNGH